MKKSILVSILFFIGLQIVAQDSVKVNKVNPPRHLKVWHISDLLATPDTISIDTIYLNFPDKNLIDNFSIANSYDGNLGSAIQSKLYFKRRQGSDFMCDDAYSPYIYDLENTAFYDVKFPFSNLMYRTGGKTSRKEDQIKFTFAASPSKKTGFGTVFDYYHSVGSYKNQAARRFAGSVFGRYEGKHYSAYGVAAVNNLQNHENGGLTDPNIVNNELGSNPKDWSTNLADFASFKKNSIFYNHKYSVGFNREVKITADSTSFEYIPVSHFGHTLKYEEMFKRYYEPSVDTIFYDNTYYKKKGISHDTTFLRTLSNTFFVNLDERFNKWMKFGITGYIQNEVQQFGYLKDTTLNRMLKSNTRVGGVLSKNEGVNFRYSVLGDIYLVGYKAGEFRLEGKATGNFNIGSENILLAANAAIRNEEPSLFLQYYNSNHFKWENSFAKTYKTSVGGLFSLTKRKTLLKLDIENITNSIFFNKNALPQQFEGNVQIISADLKQDFKLGHFTLENNVVYQLSSNNDVIPLPTFSLFHNLYYHGKWFNVLQVQLGVNMRMHTRYFAPAYMPATGQFYVQNKTQVGNYPVMNMYMNYHLKFARFFFEYYHFNHWFMKGESFSMPDYPYNPTLFKMGLSWNFFN